MFLLEKIIEEIEDYLWDKLEDFQFLCVSTFRSREVKFGFFAAALALLAFQFLCVSTRKLREKTKH